MTGSRPLASERCRFAPTTSGPAHPGTLLAALLCWLDARSLGAHVLLRLEDIDPTRCTPENADDMRAALAWLGLDWDAEALQSERRAAHEAALDGLVARDLVYPCRCSRSEIRRAGIPAADGSWRYPGTCRRRSLPEAGWRACREALRLRLAPGRIETPDESGAELGQDPHREIGDPVLRRGDGAVAYHLAVVVDDADDGITRIVRGRDLASSTGVQRALQARLALPTPAYRHHALLLERRGEKLAKLHGAVGWRDLRAAMTAEDLCGFLAWTAGLRDGPGPATPRDLLMAFTWESVTREDQILDWTGRELVRVSSSSAR